MLGIEAIFERNMKDPSFSCGVTVRSAVIS